MEQKLTTAQRRVLEHIKRQDDITAAQLAASLGHTPVAVRQHLATLERGGLVEQSPQQAAGRGRPPTGWRLTARAQQAFPDRHAELTLDLLQSAREAFGEEGVERLVQIRAQRQTTAYQQRLARAGASLKRKVAALARVRSAEGYMAEAHEEERGVYLLIERHCPICEAAKYCSGLCSAELEVFRRALGPAAKVERTAHMLSAGTRCAYRITAASGA